MCIFHVYKKNDDKKQNKFASNKITLPISVHSSQLQPLQIIGFASDKITLPVAGKVGVMALAFDPYGMLWIGTRGGGLFRYNPSLKTFKLYNGEKADPYMFSSNIIWALHAISGGRLLIGTEG